MAVLRLPRLAVETATAAQLQPHYLKTLTARHRRLPSRLLLVVKCRGSRRRRFALRSPAKSAPRCQGRLKFKSPSRCANKRQGRFQSRFAGKRSVKSAITFPEQVCEQKAREVPKQVCRQEERQ